MKRIRYSLLLVLGSVVLLTLFPAILPAGSASEGGPAMKNLMGENFIRMQNILYYLITSHYAEVTKDAEEIQEHASSLLKGEITAEGSGAPSQEFLLFAGRLQSAARSLGVISRELGMHDQPSARTGRLNMDYLRSVAAEHYGEMVTSCVLCHNQFRRKMVE